MKQHYDLYVVIVVFPSTSQPWPVPQTAYFPTWEAAFDAAESREREGFGVLLGRVECSSDDIDTKLAIEFGAAGRTERRER